MSNIASGNIVELTQDLFSKTQLFDLTDFKRLRASDDGDEGGEGGDEGGGESEGDEGGEGDEGKKKGGASSGGKPKEDDGDEDDEPSDAKLKSEEAKKLRLQRNEEREARRKAEEKLEELERKDRSDKENAEKDRDKFKTTAETLAEENTALKVKVALFESGALNTFKDPADSGRYLKFEDFVDKEGEVESDKLKAKLTKLKKDKPYLFKGEEDDGDEGTPSGSKPKNKKKGEGPTRESLESKFPALRR